MIHSIEHACRSKLCIPRSGELASRPLDSTSVALDLGNLKRANLFALVDASCYTEVIEGDHGSSLREPYVVSTLPSKALWNMQACQGQRERLTIT